MRQRGEEVLVDGIALAVDALFLGHLCFEAPALQVGIGQLAEGVGQLHAAGIKLEALGDARVGCFGPRQRGQMRGVLGQKRRPAIAEVGLYPFDENAALVWARLMADGKAQGRPRSALDTIIAAVAEANGCLVVTDNEKDFAGIELINPIKGPE